MGPEPPARRATSARLHLASTASLVARFALSGLAVVVAVALIGGLACAT